MTERLTALVAQLGAATRELNDVSDELNELFEEIEDVLVQAGVGVEVFGRADATHGALGFCRIEKTWKLAVRRSDASVQPLLDSSRDTRVALAPQLEVLVGLLLERVQQELDKVRHARQCVDKILRRDDLPMAMEDLEKGKER